MEAILKKDLERKLIGAFIGLNVLDAFLTMMLIKQGWLCREMTPIMGRLFTVLGPPNYSFAIFWAVKMGLAVACVPFLYYLAKIAPRIRVLIFSLPVAIMICVCVLNALGLIIYGNLL